ncbi:NAD(P)-binding protein [Maritimibacter sp. DP07]|uniref:NAD(P)-binding protein n=1 Tax=Maritimibacter harenae TaxID=2606218 RepID=A0A845LZE5_9RHOB|nr:NAD(P)/FAD-dependent oxidoreductase [Maritimibacter harenae]MZR13410.1 NAD(P)-binding protein [Maritimibacter harenae]
MTREAQGLNGLELDVAVIGAGFAGLYALKKVRDDLDLNAQAFDDAGGVGGTWYWNRYPGCRVDTEAHVYQYSFDETLMKEWEWSERYPLQPEVLSYMNAVADKHDLKRSINFSTRIVKAEWIEDLAKWELTTAGGQTFRAKFVIEGVGLLSSTKVPSFPGEADFKGIVHHAARWPDDADLSGKRVAVIGTGSTGTQMIVELSKSVDELFVLQRTPQYVVPLGCGPFPEHERARIKEDPAAFRDWQLDTAAVFGFKEATISAHDVTAEERERVFEDAWQNGNGFAFMLNTFSDIIVDEAANKAATDFVRKKISEIVDDPETAEKLMPSDFYAKRPLATDDYYETFNKDNVTLVDVKEDRIDRILAEGLKLQSGRVIEVDVIIYATGFDAITGNYLKIDTTGRDGLALADKWKDHPTAMMGLCISGFPNMFMIFGPFSPFTSQPLVHEWQVNWIAGAIKETLDRGAGSFEVTQKAEDEWVKACDEVAAMTLFSKTDSWINGSNVEGKSRQNYFYMAGMAQYMSDVKDITDAGYKGFAFGEEPGTNAESATRPTSVANS